MAMINEHNFRCSLSDMHITVIYCIVGIYYYSYVR